MTCCRPPGTPLRLLIVGINPGLWTAAVNAPFAHPGNRFWPSLYRGGLTDRLVDASAGFMPADEEHLAERGIGITNLVGQGVREGRRTQRATNCVRAGKRLVGRLSRPEADASRHRRRHRLPHRLWPAQGPTRGTRLRRRSRPGRPASGSMCSRNRAASMPTRRSTPSRSVGVACGPRLGVQRNHENAAD